MMKRVPILLPIAVALALPVSAAADLTLDASEATATIAPRKSQRIEVPLPALTFDIVALARCEGEPESLTISIADSHRSWAGSDIAEDGIVETSISVPFPQLSLVIAGSTYCLAGVPAEPDSLLVPGIGTVQASLQCRSESGVSMRYASEGLALRLSCAVPDPQDPPLAPPR